MKKVVRLSESDLARVVSRIINEQPTPGSVVPSTSQQMQTPRTTSQTPRQTSQTPMTTSQTPGPQMPAAQRSPTPFNPQHKGTFEVDCKAGLSKLGYAGKLSKEGNKLFVDLFCNPKYRNR